MAFMQAVKVIRQIISNAAVERVLQQAALLGEEWEPC